MKEKFRVLFLYPNLMLTPMVPVSVALFSALLTERGFEVGLFDTTFYKTDEKGSDDIKVEHLNVKPFDWKDAGITLKDTDLYEDLRKKIESFSPNLIAVSCVEDTYPLGLAMIKNLRRYCKVPVIVGGVFATFAPEKVIGEECIDMLCRGEGENTLIELCEKQREGRDCSRIKGLWIKKDKKVIKNPLRQLTDINSLPIPDFSIFNEKRLYRPMAGKIYKMFPIETHRGCPFSCAYCNSPASKRLYDRESDVSFFRKKSITKIYNEISFLFKKWHFEYIYFPADTFLSMDRKEFEEFAERYSDFKIPFWIQTRPETLNRDNIELLKKIGCHRVSIGIEHGNEEFRKKVIKRSVTNKKILEVCKLLEDYRIPFSVNNIIGFPDETRELAFDTIMLNRKIKSDDTNAYAFVPYHGTILRDICLKKGYIGRDTETAWLTKDTVLNMPQFSKQEIKGLMRTFVLYAKLPEADLPKIKIAESFNEEGNKMFDRLKDMYRGKY